MASAEVQESASASSNWQGLNTGFLSEFGSVISLHDAHLYDASSEYKEEVNGWEQMEAERSKILEIYEEKGCIIIRNAFTPQQVSGCIDALNDVIDGKNKDFAEACEKTKQNMQDNSNGGCVNSILQFEGASKDVFGELSTVQKRDSVRKLHGFSRFDPRFIAIRDHPELLKLVRNLLNMDSGERLKQDPVIFQDMVLCKPPRIGREKPWHQDNAYFNLMPEEKVVGVWIALDEALPQNGCMHIIPGSHKKGTELNIWPHFQLRDWQICDKDIENSKNNVAAVCLKPGDMMIFNGMIPHGTPANLSELRRRAIQFHYIKPGVNVVDTEVRLQVYGAEGKGVSC